MELIPESKILLRRRTPPTLANSLAKTMAYYDNSNPEFGRAIEKALKAQSRSGWAKVLRILRLKGVSETVP